MLADGCTQVQGHDITGVRLALDCNEGAQQHPSSAQIAPARHGGAGRWPILRRMRDELSIEVLPKEPVSSISQPTPANTLTRSFVPNGTQPFGRRHVVTLKCFVRQAHSGVAVREAAEVVRSAL